MSDAECRSLAGAGFAAIADELLQIDRHLRSMVEPLAFSEGERVAFRKALSHLRQAKELLGGLSLGSCSEKGDDDNFPP
jgi:hypothetical protein